MNKQNYNDISVLIIKSNQKKIMAFIACNLFKYLFNSVAFILLKEKDIINEQKSVFTGSYKL